MGRSQTFSVSLSLLTKNFEKGINKIKSSLQKLRGQFMSIMGGIGLGLGVNELVESARKLDKAQAVLRNVSKSSKDYGDSLKFVNDLSKKYNQELTVLMGNYAKFYSIASNSGMALEQQKSIYEALTRASAFFNLSADETNSVMLAVNQMMSKGKVSSEEFTRQLSERLPGTLGIVADAYKVTAGQMLKMIQNGEVMANDMLPKLAEGLNKLTTNLNVDTIEGATNKMKNSFTDLVAKLNVGDVYKKVLNTISKLLDYVTRNFNTLKQNFTAFLLALTSNSMMSRAKEAWTGYFSALSIEVEKLKRKADSVKSLLERRKSGGYITFDIDSKGYITNLQKMEDISDDAFEQIRNQVKKYNQSLDEIATKTLPKVGEVKPIVAGWAKVKYVFNGVTTAVKQLWKAYWPLLAVYAVTRVIQEWREWRKEVERVRDLIKDTLDQLENRIKKLSSEEVELNLLKVAMFDTHSYDEARKGIIDQINKLLGTDFKVDSTNFEINQAINERLALLKEERSYQEQIAEISEQKLKKEEALKELQSLREKKKTLEAERDKMPKGMGPGHNAPEVANAGSIEETNRKIALKEQEIANITELIEQLTESSKGLAEGAAARQAAIEAPFKDKDGGSTISADYKKIQEEYNNKLRALNDQAADKVITEEDYDKALRDLIFSTLESIYALDNINENTDPFAKALMDAALAYLEADKKQSEVDEALTEYYKKTINLADQLDNGIITQEEYEDALYDLKEEVLKNLISMGSLTEAAEELAEQYRKQKKQKTFDNISKEAAPQIGNIDTRLNYNKSDSDIYGENVELLENYAKDLEEYIERIKEYKKELSGDDLDQLNKYIEELEGNLGTLSEKATSFAEAAVFAEVQEDIQNMKKELNEGIWDNITGIASAAERLTSSWKSLTETMQDPDASGWEKFLTIFTTLISTIETIVSVVKTFQAAMAVAETLSLATAAAEQAGIPIKIEDMVATKMQAAAAKELAVARHMAAAASVPYPANLAAIASTSAALAAAFAAIPAFAQGGVVEGASSVGDRNLIRVNGGEAVLTKGQQATLWKLLDGQTSMMQKGGALELKVRGSDLVAVLNNYQKKISK